jgi:diguanylate cyclase (GGDEF)-like protein
MKKLLFIVLIFFIVEIVQTWFHNSNSYLPFHNTSYFIIKAFLVLIIIYYFYRMTKELLIDKTTNLYSKTALIHVINKTKFNEKFNYILVIDIDNFSLINRRFGFIKADNYLKYFGILLHDVFSINDQIFRYGGDEFIVFSRNKTENEISTLFAELNIRIKEDSDFSNVSVSMIFTSIKHNELCLFDTIIEMLNKLVKEKEFRKGLLIKHFTYEK